MRGKKKKADEENVPQASIAEPTAEQKAEQEKWRQRHQRKDAIDCALQCTGGVMVPASKIVSEAEIIRGYIENGAPEAADAPEAE